MSRITGSDAASLMEAYNAVYAPQELTEEQVWEEVENWVNSLVEEGYDLSEYTWEDMYEAYIEEQGRNTTPQAVIDRNRSALGNTLGRLGNRIMTGNPEGTRPPIRQTPNRRGGGTNTPPVAAKPQIGNLPSNLKSTEQGATAAGMRVAGKMADIRGSQTPGSQTPKTTSTTSSTPRPAAPAPAQGGARPTATPGAAKPAPAAVPAAAPVRTPNPLMQKTFGYQTGQAPSQIAATRAATTTAARNLSGTGALASRPTATPTPTPTTKPNMPKVPSTAAPAGGVKLSARAQALKAGGPKGGARERMLNQSFDAFDAIKGHLLDEGYAETEEAAAVIMANMSEEWKTQIIESGYFPTKESQRADEAKYKKGSSEVKHRTPQTQARPTPSK